MHDYCPQSDTTYGCDGPDCHHPWHDPREPRIRRWARLAFEHFRTWAALTPAESRIINPLLIGLTVALTFSILGYNQGLADGRADVPNPDHLYRLITNLADRCLEDEVAVWDGEAHPICVPLDIIVEHPGWFIPAR